TSVIAVVAANHNGIIAGTAAGSGLPATAGAWAPSPIGASDKFVCEVTGDDGTPVFCTYLKSASISITSIGTDNAGDIYVLADRGNDPSITATAGALALGTTTYLMKLNPSGSAMLWIAELGGKPAAMSVDAAGDVYLAGVASAADFPSAVNLQTVASSALFVAKVDPSGQKLLFATFGAAGDSPAAVAIDTSGATYLTGNAAANTASFATKFATDGSRALYRTALPLNPNNFTLLERGPNQNIAADADGNAIIVGFTQSLTGLALTATCRQANLPYAGSGTQQAALEAFLVRLGPDGSLLQSTWIGTGTTAVDAFAITGAASQAYVTAQKIDSTGIGILRVGPDTTGASLTSIGCMTNAATFATGALAPGEIFSIFGDGLGPDTGSAVPFGADGKFPAAFAGATVTFDDIGAPLLYVQSGQINAITPWELAGKTSTRMCAVYLGKTSCTTAAVGGAAPGSFIVNPLPAPGSAVVNQDGTLNSPTNAAPVGSIVTLYGTGLGPEAAAPADGSLTQLPLPALASPVEVHFMRPGKFGPGTITPPIDTAGEISYAGPAPLEVSGLVQINVRVPSVPPGAFTVGVRVRLPDGKVVTDGAGSNVTIR
ncbi:MAG TPA: hypothetical protein VHZ74_05680, partial [Bryobacteraceae bacterium]|nr:hypothetical protein [Bryobacteraceae bacterium]